MTQEAIREIIRRQREFFYTGATLNIDFRIEALKKLQASIQAHQEQIDAALKADLGKSSFESYMCEFRSCSQRDHLSAEAYPFPFQRKNCAYTTCTISLTKLPEAVSLRCFTDHESMELSVSSHL